MSPEEITALKAQIDAQAAKVKALKDAGKTNKDDEVKAEVAALLKLKSQLPAEPKSESAAASTTTPASTNNGGDDNAAAGGDGGKNKKAERQAARLAEEQAKAKAKAEQAAQFSDIFGTKLIDSSAHKTTEFVEIKNLNAAAHIDKVITIRARIFTARKQSSKMAFLVLRQTYDSIQALVLANESVPADMVAFAAGIPAESIVDIEAKVVAPDHPVTSTSCPNLELRVQKIHVVSESLPILPFQVVDASRSESKNEQNLPVVNIDTRLLTRWLDLRTPASNAIFRLQSRVGQYFREFLINNEFVEIHSPKMIGTASEGGAGVFKLDYMGRPGYLAQSPQLYKQMSLQGDLERVFEVGPVFRAENSNTHRHLTEFTGLDIEMRLNQHYYEVLDMGEELFDYMFTKLITHTKELEAVNDQYPFSPFVWQIPEDKFTALGVGIIEDGVASKDTYGAKVRNNKLKMLRMEFPRAIALLNTKLAEPLAETDDINTENEKLLGRIVKERYGVDFYIVDRFPLCLRPFYTMPCPDDKRFSNSYDIFMRGEEISSGAQRVHIPDLLEQRATTLGVPLHQLKDYVDSFRLGAWPHGGFGVGLERVVMLYLGLRNIRYCSLFPRDPQRLTP